MGFFNNKNKNSNKTGWLVPPGARKHQQQQQRQPQQYNTYGGGSSSVSPSAPPSTSTYTTTSRSTPTSTYTVGSPAPKKYINVNGVMKKNPEWQQWKNVQDQGTAAATTTPATTGVSPPTPSQSQTAQIQLQQQQQQQHLHQTQQQLGFVSNMDDHAQLNQDLQQDVPLSDAVNATIEMMQEPEICLEAGMRPDEMVDSLGSILNKYEVPMGLMNKLMMLSEYQSLEFIVDDSGSMNLISDTINPTTGQPNTRWQEAHQRLKEMVEILAHVPFTQIGIEFLNRQDRIQLKRLGGDASTGMAEAPRDFIQRAYTEIDKCFLSRPPSGTTPVLEKLQESFLRGQGYSIARYLMCDGRPNGGSYAIQQITSIVKNRADPSSNPMTFLSCTNEDEQVEWMKDAEEIAPYCSEADDYDDERREVIGDQGVALPYTRGFWLVCQLVAAMNPDDLDAMDESVPFTKSTLDNLLGHVSSIESYKYYWDHFLKAQASRVVSRENGQPSPVDLMKKRQRWNYNDFVRAPVARDIPQVQQFKQQMIQMSMQQH